MYVLKSKAYEIKFWQGKAENNLNTLKAPTVALAQGKENHISSDHFRPDLNKQRFKQIPTSYHGKFMNQR